MGMLSTKRKVEQQLRGKNPKDIVWFFFDRALVLAKEAGVEKRLLHERVDELMK